jgi:hypothetical protein
MQNVGYAKLNMNYPREKYFEDLEGGKKSFCKLKVD